jgi:hypothetical protein
MQGSLLARQERCDFSSGFSLCRGLARFSSVTRTCPI